MKLSKYEQEKIDKGKNIMAWSAIGFLVTITILNFIIHILLGALTLFFIIVFIAYNVACNGLRFE